MKQQRPFRTTMRGYDRAEVEARVDVLTGELASAREAGDGLARAQQQVAQLTTRLQQAERERDELADAPPPPVPEPTYAALGERVAAIMTLADEEGRALRQQAADDAQEHRQAAEAHAATQRAHADQYAQEVRTAADAAADRIREDARRHADELVDDADRDAVARRAEADAYDEHVRARAAQASADVELSLAQRRTKVEQDAMVRGAAAEAELAELQDRIEQMRHDAVRAHREAMAQATGELEQAHEQASAVVAAAHARAARIRADSDREVAAAGQRRDSINAQLTNVRQLLATLSGTAPAAAVAHEAGREGRDVDAAALEPTDEPAPRHPDEPRTGADGLDAWNGSSAAPR